MGERGPTKGTNGVLFEAPPAPQGATTVTILDTESLSGVADLRAIGVPVGLQMDAAWDTNAVTFQGSYDGVVYTDLRLSGVEVALAGVVASSMEALDPYSFMACRYLKVRSGTSGAPVNQVGDTIVTVIAKPMI